MIPPQAVLGEETLAKLIGVVACHIKSRLVALRNSHS